MKAATYTQYGPPEVLQIQEVNIPQPKAKELLIRIHATTVTTTECYFRKGRPFITRLFTGLTKPKINRLGEELAGVVEAIGDEVTQFKPGDTVFGTAGPKFGANAEYLCTPEDGVLAPKPANLSFGEAAASVDGVLTALPFLRDVGQLQAGQRVLIYGASGSVGAAAVQIARYLGAEVTGVCSTRNLELVQSIGAHQVIDYTQEDYTSSGQSYNIVFDAVGKTTFAKAKKVLTPNGVFLEAGITLSIVPQVIWSSLFEKKKIKIAATGIRPPKERLKDLEWLKERLEQRDIVPVVDKIYPFEEIVEAHRYVDQGRKRGNVVLLLEHFVRN